MERKRIHKIHKQPGSELKKMAEKIVTPESKVRIWCAIQQELAKLMSHKPK